MRRLLILRALHTSFTGQAWVPVRAPTRQTRRATCPPTLFSATTGAPDPVSNELLSLQVSSPALLLNHMAERYVSTSRILMEFVDNSLDDAEAFFDPSANAYSRPVIIEVRVSPKDRRIVIRDNGRGMARDVLSSVVVRVGESRKRGQSFVNGQFGFGMQAFRAACQTLTVRSRSRSAEERPLGAVHQVPRASAEKNGGVTDFCGRR